LIDVRLGNTSQLAGFAKRDDLSYFLRELCGAEYHHEPTLAPTKEILDAYKKKQISWEEYHARFLDLLIDGTVLSVGLTRKFRSSDQYEPRHWLQVNNIHIQEDPAWLLG
jgi:hypothetical protein